MGEIRSGESGFMMMTPAGVRNVTLRCRDDGTVMVEKVAGGGLAIQPLRINIEASPVDAHSIARARRAALGRERSA